jgi:hypothetical protein
MSEYAYHVKACAMNAIVMNSILWHRYNKQQITGL